ncbi:hypothetical protein FOA52_000704 [Chlamydomonas sp. UWO 241]|nr:hypothetical protein FOA52_000704 [Chlamydomonas sp. UWO 241]
MDQLISQLAGARLQTVVGPVREVGQLSAAQLADLQRATVCALDCEGIDITRLGRISIVSLATETTCFLFDVLDTQRTPGVVTLLKGLLEDAGVTKIVHDTKMDVDALHHQLKITVVNAHDTQAGDQVLTGHRSNLNDTLERYDCSRNSERDRNLYASNDVIWATRPLTQRLIDYASGDVQSLFRLREEQRSEADYSPAMRSAAWRHDEEQLAKAVRAAASYR